MLLSNSLYAQSALNDIYLYTPKAKGYINTPEGFSVQILKYNNAIQYNIFNNTKGSTDVIAWKSTPQKVSIITRLRGWNTEREAQYFLIEVNEDSKAKVQTIEGIPIIDKDYYCCIAKTNDNAINFRAEGTINGTKIGQYSKNNEVIFTGGLVNKCSIEDANDYWYSFNYNGETAWIYGKYISFDFSAVINEDTLGLKPTKESSGKTEDHSYFKDISKLSIEATVTNTKDPNQNIYDLYRNADTLISVENNGVDIHHNSKITVAKGNKILSSIESLSGQHAYSPDGNRLFYVTYGWGDSNFLNCIDCSNGHAVLLNSDNNNGLSIYGNNIDINPSGSYVLFLSQISTRELDETPILAINFLSTKDNSVTTLPLDMDQYNRNVKFGFLKDDIIYIKGLSKKNNDLIFYRFNGNSLIFISKGNIEYGMDFDNNGNEDWFNYYKAPGISYVLISFDPNYNGANKSFILGLDNSSFKDFSSTLNGFIINTFHYNGQWYFGTIKYSDPSQKVGTIYIYDHHLHIVNQGIVKCNEYSWGTIISKIGTKDDNIIVVFSQIPK